MSGLLPFVLGAFGAGLLALITPCVFPMIPITVAFFTKQATSKDAAGVPNVNQGEVVKLAAIYSLGIVLAFTALGAVAAATIGAAGAQRFAANPWTNLAFAALFLVFGLALLEIFEIRLPLKIQNLAAGGQKASGLVGVLGLGLTFVIAAFTCTAPFIGTVLVAAAQAKTGADWVRPVLGMAVFASALALPFFLLALFPSLLARLPKSGSWLTTVKGAMGFLELAAALKFLSNADLTLHINMLTRPLMLALTALILLAGSFWLLGRLNIGWSTPTGKASPVRLFWAGAYAVCALYLLYGLTGRPVAGFLEAYLPPTGNISGVTEPATAIASTNGSASAEPEKMFINDIEGAKAEAKRTNRLIFIDFTGYSCTNCRWMEKNIFPKPEVDKTLKQFVRLVLYTDEYTKKDKDGRRIGEVFQDFAEKNYGTVATPLYGVLTANGLPVKDTAGQPIKIEYEQNPQKFADFLTKAQAAGIQKVAQR